MVEPRGSFTARKPQQARSAATQRRLLEAGVRCLVEEGHGGTTTTAVAKAAGVSQGALYKHFPTKQDLLAATIAHLFRELVQRYTDQVAALSVSEGDRVKPALDLLWSIFTCPELCAVYDLYSAARTDDQLAAALRPVIAEHRENLEGAARALFPEAAARTPDFAEAVHTLMMAMQGTALMAAAVNGPAPSKAEMSFIEGLARRELQLS